MRGLKDTLRVMERLIIFKTLLDTKGNVAHAALRLGVRRTTLFQKIVRLGFIRGEDGQFTCTEGYQNAGDLSSFETVRGAPGANSEIPPDQL